MADVAIRLGQARELHAQSRWTEAYAQFSAADRAERLDAEDLERYAEAAQILGRGDEAIRLLRRAFNTRIDAGELDRAMTSAFWLWQALIINTEFARASGWAAQVRRSMPDVDNGWLLVADAYFLLAAANYDQAAQLLASAADAGSRQGDTDLIAFATTVWGRALIKAGRLQQHLRQTGRPFPHGRSVLCHQAPHRRSQDPLTGPQSSARALDGRTGQRSGLHKSRYLARCLDPP
jgi:tetratricopeptide (TPR) repeat protein